MIRISHIWKSYHLGEHTVHALKDLSLEIEQGDYVAIMGPSGSGKSTLMHLIGLLDVPTSGSYQIYDQEVSKLGEDELAGIRSRVLGFIFQQFNLISRMSAGENVALPLLYSGKTAENQRGAELLGTVGLGNRVFHRPNELSGGQQQRVAIARSLVNQPLMILADEPTGNLDSNSEQEILEILKALNDKGITIVMVTHEEEVGQKAKRLIRMRDGVIQSDERLIPINVKEGSKLAPSAAAAPRSSWSDTFEYVRQGFKTLFANKVRTGLSMLGILIGVAAVIAMLAIGKGAQKDIESRLASLGSNLLVLRAGAVRVGGVSQESGATTRLTLEDVQALRENISSIKSLAPSVTGRIQVTYENKNWSTQVQGTLPSYAEIRASPAQIGRFFTEEENQTRNRVALIGTTVQRELFGDKNPIGEMIKINKASFQVIGILQEKGASGGFRDQDDNIVVPILTAMHRLLGKEYVDSVDIEIKSAEEIDSAQEDILSLMSSRHRMALSQQQGGGFEIRNMADVQEALSESSKTMSMLLASIAGISLLVGGIGIMNIMLVSVTERTKEIGLRKAIGAKRADILTQFLSESVVVTTVGGVIGIVLGWAITVAISYFAGWSTSVSMQSVLLAFIFSSVVGIVFGIYPARKASLLNPIDALRFE